MHIDLKAFCLAGQRRGQGRREGTGLTAGELEVTDVFVERKAAELHPLADRRQIAPGMEERDRHDINEMKRGKKDNSFRQPESISRLTQSCSPPHRVR